MVRSNWNQPPLTIADRSVRGGRADVLYSELSGEELLQQWLTTHPEVLARYEEQKMKERERRREREGDDGVNDASSGLRGPSREDLPLYLEPYRSFLPQSLMTPTARTAFPHSLATNDESEWG